LKFLSNIFDYLKFLKFQTNNTKALAKDLKSQYHSYLFCFIQKCLIFSDSMGSNSARLDSHLLQQKFGNFESLIPAAHRLFRRLKILETFL